MAADAAAATAVAHSAIERNNVASFDGSYIVFVAVVVGNITTFAWSSLKFM